MMSRIGKSLLILEAFARGPTNALAAEALQAAKEVALSIELGPASSVAATCSPAPDFENRSRPGNVLPSKTKQILNLSLLHLLLSHRHYFFDKTIYGKKRIHKKRAHGPDPIEDPGIEPVGQHDQNRPVKEPG
jgi:hypothetical protein